MLNNSGKQYFKQMTSLEISYVGAVYHGKRVLITGATGFIGQHLLDAFGGLAAEVAVVARGEYASSKAQRVFVGDMRDQVFVRQTIRDFTPHYIFHLAGARDRVLTREAFGQAIEANLMGALNLFFAALDVPSLERIVILGTAEEYGGNKAPFVESMREAPISAYSFSKQCATHLTQLMHCSFGLPVVILRPSVAYGPAQRDDMFLSALIQTLLRGEEFSMTLGEQTRDYVYVSDLVDALLRAGYCPDVEGEVINIGSGKPIQIARLVDRVEGLLGCAGLVRRGALEYRTGEPMEYWLDISKAKQLLGWMPKTSLDDGLRSTVGWYQDRHG
ncbi:MAG: NAD-dependent epimerase/dehydratase family protein [Gallionellaceae bacterium]|jgi:nucleoside-diphosphate-sugar epimerase